VCVCEWEDTNLEAELMQRNKLFFSSLLLSSLALSDKQVYEP